MEEEYISAMPELTPENNSREVESTAELYRASADSLPKDVVHCFPASKSKIVFRRAVSVVLGLAFLAGTVYFLLPDSFGLLPAAFAVICFALCVLVLVQTFLIAAYRVALDYEQKEVVLRYQFQKIRIPYEDFDTRQGMPDRAETLLSMANTAGSKKPVRYLILDNVRDSACYQTTSKELAGIEDFEQLKAEAENIRDVYRGKPEGSDKPEGEEDEMTRIINSALADKPKNIDE